MKVNGGKEREREEERERESRRERKLITSGVSAHATR